MNNTIYQKRYSSYEEGRTFMEEVDYRRRDELYMFAEEVSESILHAWSTINPDKSLAIILFGSIATGLVKRADHPNPSNIDLAVIGDFTTEEREMLFVQVRKKRDEVQAKILHSCPAVDPQEKNPGNVGLFIQQPYKLENDGYKCALEYISANAVVLHDPDDIWADIQDKALAFYVGKMRKSRRYPYLWKDEV